MPDLIGKLAVRPDRPERLAILGSDGDVLATFAADATRDEITASLASAGLTLTDDNRVWKGK